MIVAENLNYEYEGYFDLENISLNIKPGEILGVIGHSGSGKSTLLKILAGLKEPLSGKVYLNGKILETPAKKLIARHEKIKLVAQQNNLFPLISIFENIAYELRYYEKDYQNHRVEYLAEALNLRKLLKKLPRELSGGEIQRVMIAKALADEPWVLLLDEPMANLDRINKSRAVFELQEVIKNESIACAMVTHDISDAFGLSDKILILEDGKNIQEGSPKDIYCQPENINVANLSGLLNEIDGEFFRPENIIPNSEGMYEGIVVGSVFQGAHFDIWIKVGEDKILYQSIEFVNPGTRFKFDVRSFIHFD